MGTTIGKPVQTLEYLRDSGVLEENKMLKTFKIYFSDLNEDAQKRIMEMVKIDDPKEMNWDIDMCPIAMYDVEVDD